MGFVRERIIGVEVLEEVNWKNRKRSNGVLDIVIME